MTKFKWKKPSEEVGWLCCFYGVMEIGVCNENVMGYGCAAGGRFG